MFQDFVYTKANAMPAQLCQEIIEQGEYHLHHDTGIVEFGDSGSEPLSRQDTQLFLPLVMQNQWHNIHKPLLKGYEEYQNQYEICKGYPVESRGIKWQKTAVGQSGFASWHIEQHGHRSTSDRFAVWMIYLNDVAEGGETEFIYQKLKLKPEQGTLVIWPAGLTHPHRGNPPYSNDKYILTGWLNLTVMGV